MKLKADTTEGLIGAAFEDGDFEAARIVAKSFGLLDRWSYG